MPNYDLDRLGDKQFEHLIQALLKKIIGAGTITFGEGADGGREATYTGKAPYPSSADPWEGEWLFQAKFHNTRQIGPEKARKEVLNDLRTELEKVTLKQKRRCDNYILATNVPLSSVAELGTHDKIAHKIVPEFIGKIPHIHVWGYDDLSRFLDGSPDIRRTYMHLITPGDLIAELLDHFGPRKSALAETVQAYVRTSFDREQYAQLDQAGEIGEKPMPLRRVFIDLDVQLRNERDLQALASTIQYRDTKSGLMLRMRRLERLASREKFSATETLVSSDIRRTVLIGGPGQGKSTLGQFIAQIHRAYLLKRVDELNGENGRFTPDRVRVPFRVILKDYAQWIVDSNEPHNVERFLAAIVEERAGRAISSEQIQEIFKLNPTLLILDGLDEVTDKRLRTRMLELLTEFIARCEDVFESDLQIVSTSRPTGYSDQFDPSRFLHLTLVAMGKEKALEYTERWIKAKTLESAKGTFLRNSIEDCLADAHFSPLMNTPLQVTIFILIILGGGTPPRQREELFNEYLEVIYKRERAKSKTIIQTEKRLLFGLHQYLGYLLHRRAADSSDIRSRMEGDEFAEEVLRYLLHNDPYSDREELKKRADQIMTEAQERLVLLVGLEPGLFGFELRSIQEFFAAGYLTDTASDNRQRFERFQSIALPPHWRNVALFFTGRVGRCYPGEAAHILEACREIDRHKPDYYARRGAWLALEIAVDRSFGPARILQRSAIEYALTLLDGDLDRKRRSEFTSRLSQLPEEDFEHHVMPLFSQRLDRIHFPEGFYALEVFRSLAKDPSLVQEALASGFDRGTVSHRDLLEKALELRVPPDYIAHQFEALLHSLAEEELVDILLGHFIDAPEYVTVVVQLSGLPDAVCLSILNSALEMRLTHPLELSSQLQLFSLASVAEEAKLAWQLATLIEQPRAFGHRFWDEAFTTWKHRGDLDFLESVVSQERGPAVMQRRVTSEIGDLVVDPSTLPELRATALAILARSLFFGSESMELLEIANRFDLSLSSEEEGREKAERILYRFAAPSLEMMAFLREAGESVNTLREMFLLTLEKTNRFNLTPVSVFDPLTDAQFAQTTADTWRPKGLPKGFPSRFLRVIARFGGAPHQHQQDLNADFAASGLTVISEIIRRHAADEWRAWATLSRITSFKWFGKSGTLIRRAQNLESALSRLCEVLEERKDSTRGHWAICQLVARTAEISKTTENVERLLAIIGDTPDRWADRRHRDAYPRASNIRSADAVLKIAKASNEIVFRGFLKWFAFAAGRTHPGFEEFTEIGPFLQFDLARVCSVLENGAQGSIREGAILLLAYSRAMSFEDATRLLNLSAIDSKPLDRAWAELVKGTVRDLDTQESIDFLEGVVSAGSRYPKAVKYAALDKYQRIARGTTINIQEQEQDLGLPLQSLASI